MKELVQYESTMSLILGIYLKYLGSLPTSLSALKGRDLQNIIRIKNCNNQVYIHSQIYASIIELLSWINLEYPLQKEANSYKLYQDLIIKLFQGGDLEISNLYEEPLKIMTLSQANRLLFSKESSLITHASKELPSDQIINIIASFGFSKDALALPILLKCVLNDLNTLNLSLDFASKLYKACVVLKDLELPDVNNVLVKLLGIYPTLSQEDTVSINLVNSASMENSVILPSAKSSVTEDLSSSSIIEEILLGVLSTNRMVSLQNYSKLVLALNTSFSLSSIFAILLKLIKDSRLNMENLTASNYFRTVLHLISKCNSSSDLNSLLHLILKSPFLSNSKLKLFTIFELQKYYKQDIISNSIPKESTFIHLDLLEAQLELLEFSGSVNTMAQLFMDLSKNIDRSIPIIYCSISGQMLDWLNLHIPFTSNSYSSLHTLLHIPLKIDTISLLTSRESISFQRKLIEFSLLNDKQYSDHESFLLQIINNYVSTSYLSSIANKRKMKVIGSSVYFIIGLILQEYRQFPEYFQIRSKLLFNIISGDNDILNIILLWIKDNFISIPDFTSKLLLSLYFEYLQLSSVKSLLLNFFVEEEKSTEHSQTSNLLHHLVHSLLSNDPVVASNSYSLLCRLATDHPHITIRCLDNILVLLKGKINVSSTEFVERQYFGLFIYSLGILDALRPIVFEEDSISDFITVYFDVISNIRSHNQHFVNLINKFVDFLCYFAMEKNSDNILNKYTKLLKHTQKVYPDTQRIDILLGKNKLYIF